MKSCEFISTTTLTTLHFPGESSLGHPACSLGVEMPWAWVEGTRLWNQTDPASVGGSHSAQCVTLGTLLTSLDPPFSSLSHVGERIVLIL